MMASTSAEEGNNQAKGKYRTRQDLLKILLKERLSPEERRTHLAIFDVLDEARRERKQLLEENRWDAFFIHLGYEKNNGGLKVNGSTAQRVKNGKPIYTPEGKQQLKGYLSMNNSIRINPYTSCIEAIKQYIRVDSFDEAEKRGLIGPRQNLSPEICGIDMKARLEERAIFDREVDELNAKYTSDKKDVYGARHINGWGTSFYMPTWVSSKDAGGIATLFINGNNKWSHLRSEPVPYNPLENRVMHGHKRRSHSAPMEKKITPQTAYA